MCGFAVCESFSVRFWQVWWAVLVTSQVGEAGLNSLPKPFHSKEQTVSFWKSQLS
jgi:hypothetical protein